MHNLSDRKYITLRIRSHDDVMHLLRESVIDFRLENSLEKVRRRGSLGHKGQLEVADDPVHDGIIVGEEDNEAHLARTLGTDKRVKLIEFPYHLSPAPAGDPRAFFLDDWEIRQALGSLAYLPPMGIGV